AVSAKPDGTGCRVEIVELPQAQRYRRTFAHLQLKPPALVDVGRWRQCVEDGKRFLAKWGEQAQALGWTSADLFGLHRPSERPHPSYRRLSRYDCTGLIWLLEGARSWRSQQTRPPSKTPSAASPFIASTTSRRSGRWAIRSRI